MVYYGKNIGFPPLPIFLILTTYILIVWIFGSVSDFLLSILIIVTAISVFIGYRAYRISLRDREKPIIKKLIDKFEEARGKLSEYIANFYIFEFPESLNYRYQLPFDDELYNELSKIERITYSKIKKFDELGKTINEKIIELTNKAKELIEKTKAEDGSGQKWTFKKQYKKLNQENKNELLKKHDLSNDREEIKIRVEKLIVKAKKLDKKLEKKIPKLKKTYHTEYN